MRALTSSLIALIVVSILAVGGGYVGVRSYMLSPMDNYSETVLFEVADGATLEGVSRDLNAAGVIVNPRIFSWWGRITGIEGSVKAGEYFLEPGVTPASILAQLVEGRVALYPFTILEGWTTREILAAIAASDTVTGSLGQRSVNELDFLANVPGSGNPEGWFYPDTYMNPRGTTDVTVLRQAYELMQEALASAWEGRAENLPLEDEYELLTLASIIERETAIDDERTQVAGVFIRRLEKGMRLQTDPTVIYGLGASFDGNLTREHLLTDNPYNTYTRNGLPPTPIGMPSRASLEAAAHPDDGSALYFVASGEGDGRHIFSDTLEEHNAAVAAYISRLRQARRLEKENQNSE